MNKQKSKQQSKELKKYIKYLKVEAAKFKLTGEDISNLYDLFWIVDTPEEINQDFRKTLKLNKMDKWFYDFRDRIEKIVLWKLKKKKSCRFFLNPKPAKGREDFLNK